MRRCDNNYNPSAVGKKTKRTPIKNTWLEEIYGKHDGNYDDTLFFFSQW